MRLRCTRFHQNHNRPEQQIQTIVGGFRKLANWKALFYGVYSYTIFKYVGSVTIWKSINHLLLRGRVDATHNMAINFVSQNVKYVANKSSNTIQLKHFIYFDANRVRNQKQLHNIVRVFVLRIPTRARLFVKRCIGWYTLMRLDTFHYQEHVSFPPVTAGGNVDSPSSTNKQCFCQLKKSSSR